MGDLFSDVSMRILNHNISVLSQHKPRGKRFQFENDEGRSICPKYISCDDICEGFIAFFFLLFTGVMGAALHYFSVHSQVADKLRTQVAGITAISFIISAALSLRIIFKIRKMKKWQYDH